MRIKHTPGPWFLVDSDRSYYEDCEIIETGDGEEVLGVSEWIRADAPDLRLMAAAPELLDALSSMLTFYGMDEEPGEVSGVIHRRARAAIAKAKGEQG